MKKFRFVYLFLLCITFYDAEAGKPVAWVRILSTSENQPVAVNTQYYNPERGWAYRNYKYESDAFEMAKQISRAGIKVVLMDETSFRDQWVEEYRNIGEQAMQGNLIAASIFQDAVNKVTCRRE